VRAIGALPSAGATKRPANRRVAIAPRARRRALIVDVSARASIARVELHREAITAMGVTRELDGEHAIVLADTPLHTGDGWRATISLRGLCAPVELAVSIRSSRSLPSASGGPPTHELGLLLHPASSQEREALAALCARLAGPRVEDLGYLRVLVVDDNEMIRDLFAYGVRKYFRQHNCDVEVEIVGDGGTAWERLSNESYDLVLVDHYMPVLQGASLMQMIRAEPHLRALPIVAVSGGGAGVRSECLAAGADVFLPKPLVFRDLLDTLGGLVAGAARS
jgi:CheY-like chemotaxis protein